MIYIYIYPSCAYYDDDELSWRFYTMVVFLEGGSQKLDILATYYRDGNMFLLGCVATNYCDGFY